jgi:hypothetical protein
MKTPLRMVVFLSLVGTPLGVWAQSVDGGATIERKPIAQSVSLIELVAQPEKYNGKFVRVIGFCWLAFEESVLYFHEQDYSYSLSRNGVWLSLENSPVNLKGLSGHYVLFEGIFSATDRGHMSANGGSLSGITRAMRWPGPRSSTVRKTRE